MPYSSKIKFILNNNFQLQYLIHDSQIFNKVSLLTSDPTKGCHVLPRKPYGSRTHLGISPSTMART